MLSPSDLIELAVVIAGHRRVVGGFIDLSSAQVVIIIGRTWPVAMACGGAMVMFEPRKASKVRGFLGKNETHQYLKGSRQLFMALSSFGPQYFLTGSWPAGVPLRS